LENTVRYKQFDIIVDVELEKWPATRYRVIAKVQGFERARAWMTLQEFTDEKAAYEFGLQLARAWIDKQE